MNHCLILDIGKTNKKAFIFDEDYQIVFEKTAVLPETVDDDGDPCEDIDLLKNWVLDTAAELRNDPRFHIKAANCAAYGASFVHLGDDLQPASPLYNYLKPFPEDLMKQFLEKYGGAEKLSLQTASPLLGHLNSGLQLLWLKHRKPQVFNKIKYSVHLPQWIAYLLDLSTAMNTPPVSEMTSLGCHTMLWDFQKNDYHQWVKAEGLISKFPPIVTLDSADLRRHERGHAHPHTHYTPHTHTHTPLGLHDSSSALLPYLLSFEDPFVLLSTGTWCISLNPFNDEPLLPEELAQDCLCYLTYDGNPVKAARYFGGHEHGQAVKKIAADFDVNEDFYQKVKWNDTLHDPTSPEGCYRGFMEQLVEKQAVSTKLAIGQTPVRRIFVDGGFSKNEIYMALLARAFPDLEICAAEVAQATALGAALAVHGDWNEKEIPGDLVKMSVSIPASRHKSI